MLFRSRELGSEVATFGADRITPLWKLTFGANLNQSRQEFDLDEDQPLSVERRNRRVRWLGVRALGDHWSTGLTGEVRSSTFDNIALDMRIALRKSVANHLNDFSKDHPPYVVDLLRSWDLQHPHTAWIAKRACRTLIKAGDPAALALFAFSSKARVRVTDLVVTPKRLRLGDTLGFSFTVTSEATHTQPLVVDFAVHYQKADGRMARKVFKLKEVKLRPRAAITLSKRQRIVDFSTRKHYAGTHLVEVMVNGRVLAKAVFSLKC